MTNNHNEKIDSIDLKNESSLNENEKQAIHLRYIKEEDYQHISKLINTSESNVRKLVSRGLKKLKLKYGGS